MTREEALDILKDVLAYLDQGKMPRGFQDSAPAAIAALSSPCEGREVLAEGWLFDVVRDRKGAIVGGRIGAVVPSYRLGSDTPQAVIILPAEPTRQE